MLKQFKTFSGVFIILIVLACYSSVYVVKTGKIVILTSFGKALKKEHTPNYYFKLPWPFQDIISFDAKAHLTQGVEEQILTSDQNSLIVQSHVLWEIDPEQSVTFWEKISSPTEFEANLKDYLRGAQTALLGTMSFEDLFPSKGSSSRNLIEMEKRLHEKLQSEVGKQYGINILSVGFNRLGLTESVLENVHSKMNSERQLISEKLKAEGEAEAKKIRSSAQSEYDRTLAEVQGQVKEILGQAEADSIEAYRTLAKHPDLAIKLKKIESLEALLEGRSTLVLDPSVPPLDILRSTSF
ncbi:MAG: hypothetical protein HQL32_07855 [Planctomycetes bacterium]|nr:hypothetical protein [Planctomycetota bacterium]